MGMGHLLTRSGLTHLEVSLMISPGLFCLWSVGFYYPRQYIMRHSGYTVCYNQFFSIPIFCPKLGLYLVPLQSVFF